MDPVRGMTGEFLPDEVYSFLGHTVGVRSNSRAVLEHLRSMYARFYLGPHDPCSSQSRPGGEAGRHTIEVTDNLDTSGELLYNDQTYLFQFSRVGTHSRLTYQDLRAPQHSHTQLLELYDPLTFAGASLLRTVSLLLDEHYLFHAGAVSQHGQGILLPADPGMGKTTLVLKMVMLGCEFLSDDIACLSSPRGLLLPFPRRVNVREPSQELLGLPLTRGTLPYAYFGDGWEWSLDIEDICPGSLGSACVPRHVVFLRGFGDEPRLDWIARSNGLLELFECAIGQIEDPARYLFQLAGLLHEVDCYTLVIGDLDQTARLVMDLAERSGD
jgi:hypothetical protein